MSRLWIRLYTDLPFNAKMMRLPDHLHRFLMNCWCLTGASKDECLPSAEDIALRLHIEPEICAAYIEHLLRQNLLIKKQGSGKIVPKNWDMRQFVSDSSQDRTRKYRERKRKPEMQRHRDVTVTPPETEQIQNRAEQRQSAPDPAPGIAVESSEGSYLAQFTEALGKLGFADPDGDVQAGYLAARVAEVCESAGAIPKLGAYVAVDLMQSPRFRNKPIEYLLGALRSELAPKGPNQKTLRAVGR